VVIAMGILLVLLLPVAVYAADDGKGASGIGLPAGMGPICVSITGDNFDYRRDEGLMVIQGNVQACYSDFTISCDTLEVKYDGREQPVLRAYPSVSMVYGDNLAEFSGSEFTFDFNTREGGFGKVDGVFHIDPGKIDVPLDVPMDLHFQADALAMYSDRITLKHPWFGLSRPGANSDLRFYSKELQANINNSTITSAEVDRFVVRVFGWKITLLPMRLRHGFVHKRDVGVTGYLPTVSYDASDGLGIDERVFYTFYAGQDDEMFMSFRINPWLFSRFYWQTGLNYGFPSGRLSLIYGPERIEDPSSEGQVVWSNPELRFNSDLPNIGDWRHEIKGFWGDIKETSTGVESTRKGFEYLVHLKPIELGRATVSVGGRYKRSYYDQGMIYWSLRRDVAFSYDAGEDFDFKVGYFKYDEGGATPFMHDRIDVREGIRFRSQAFMSDEWGFGTDMTFDLEEDNFDKLSVGPIWVSDSMQIGLLWDFENKMVRFTAGLPKQFD
jgi:hypothetical protein